MGRRLSLAARALAYGQPVAYKNPAHLTLTALGATIEITFDTKVELRAPAVGGCAAGLRPDQCAWMAVNGANATFTLKADGTGVVVDVPAGAGGGGGGPCATAAVDYLQGDWPVPTIYAAGSGQPGLPAAPFKARVEQC